MTVFFEYPEITSVDASAILIVAQPSGDSYVVRNVLNSNFFASPPAIGGTSPSTGAFTALTATSLNVSGATTLAALTATIGTFSTRVLVNQVIRSSNASGFDFQGAGATTLATLNNSGDFTPIGILDISGAASGRIQFPATQVTSANANTLDDYEEGTFTPTVTFSTPGDLSVVYSAQQGQYTKVGNLVTFGIRLVFTPTYSTASGTIRIATLPVTPSGSAITMRPAVSTWSNVNLGAGYYMIGATIDASITYIALTQSGDAAVVGALGTTEFASGTAYTLIFEGHYYSS